ncbi:acyl carrier protein [Thalassotalea fusca]
MNSKEAILQELQSVLSGIMPNYQSTYWCEDTALFGAIPEFDSMAIVSLITELEARFDIEVDDEDISEENFANIGNIVELISNAN